MVPLRGTGDIQYAQDKLEMIEIIVLMEVTFSLENSQWKNSKFLNLFWNTILVTNSL